MTATPGRARSEADRLWSLLGREIASTPTGAATIGYALALSIKTDERRIAALAAMLALELDDAFVGDVHLRERVAELIE
jgi:hypothetical protein